MKIQTNLTKKPLVLFDKDTNIKILTASGELKLYKIDNQKGELVQEKHKQSLFE